MISFPGESYGGHYVPAWANAILDYNVAHSTDKINFGGVAIGNGCVNNTVQSVDEFVKFQRAHNLIAESDKPKNQVSANSAMAKHIGYTPNYYGESRLFVCSLSLTVSIPVRLPH